MLAVPVTDAFYQVGEVSFLSDGFENEEWRLNFLEGCFCIYWNDHVVLLSYLDELHWFFDHNTKFWSSKLGRSSEWEASSCQVIPAFLFFPPPPSPPLPRPAPPHQMLSILGPHVQEESFYWNSKMGILGPLLYVRILALYISWDVPSEGGLPWYWIWHIISLGISLTTNSKRCLSGGKNLLSPMHWIVIERPVSSSTALISSSWHCAQPSYLCFGLFALPHLLSIFVLPVLNYEGDLRDVTPISIGTCPE